MTEIIIDNGDGTVSPATLLTELREGETSEAFAQRFNAAANKTSKGKPWRIRTEADAQALKDSKPILDAKDKAFWRASLKAELDDDRGRRTRATVRAILNLLKTAAAGASPAQFMARIEALTMDQVKAAYVEAVDGD